MKFCTLIRGPKSKIEFVWDKNLITPSPILTQFLNFAFRPMGTSKRHNSVPVKDNCAPFAPTPYFWARAIRWCHLNFSPADSCCRGNELWDKSDYNSTPVNDNCALFAPTRYFQAQAIRWRHLNFSPANPCCHGNEFWDKIYYNSAPSERQLCPVCTYPSYTQLLGYSVAMGQIPRSKRRISSYAQQASREPQRGPPNISWGPSGENIFPFFF